MSKTVSIPDGTISFRESKVVCPHCGKKVAFGEIEPKWIKSKLAFIRIKHKCGKYINITTSIENDFISW